MGCCGQRRAASIPPPRADRPQADGTSATVDVRCLAQGAVAVGGPVTGRRYEFSPAAPVRAVDARDAAALLRTRMFRQA